MRLEFSQLIHKEHAVMSSADFAGHCQAGSAPDEACHRDTVVRSAKRARSVERPVGCDVAQQASDLGDLKRLAELERGEDAGQTACQHRLAGALRGAEQQVVPSGSRDLQRAARLLLSMYLGEVVLESSRLSGGGGFFAEVRVRT